MAEMSDERIRRVLEVVLAARPPKPRPEAQDVEAVVRANLAADATHWFDEPVVPAASEGYEYAVMLATPHDPMIAGWLSPTPSDDPAFLESVRVVIERNKSNEARRRHHERRLRERIYGGKLKW